MREREALEADRKAANRSIQQQTLLIGKMTEAQDTLTEEIVCFQPSPVIGLGVTHNFIHVHRYLLCSKPLATLARAANR